MDGLCADMAIFLAGAESGSALWRSFYWNRPGGRGGGRQAIFLARSGLTVFFRGPAKIWPDWFIWRFWAVFGGSGGLAVWLAKKSAVMKAASFLSWPRARRFTIPDDPACRTIHLARRFSFPDDPSCQAIQLPRRSTFPDDPALPDDSASQTIQLAGKSRKRILDAVIRLRLFPVSRQRRVKPRDQSAWREKLC